MTKITKDQSSENVMQILRADNAKLRADLIQAQRFCVEKEKKSIEYIYHISRYKSRFLQKLEDFFANFFKQSLSSRLNVVPFRNEIIETNYLSWIAQYDTLSKQNIDKAIEHISNFSTIIKFSLIINCQEQSFHNLKETLLSISNQIYKNFEVIISCDIKTKELVNSWLADNMLDQLQINFTEYFDLNEIAKLLSNNKFNITGQFITIIGSGSVLSKEALYSFSAKIDLYPEAQCIYSDEDSFDAQGKRTNPYFKPDWNAELFLAQNYVGGLCFFQKDLFFSSSRLAAGKSLEAVYFHAFMNANPVNILHIPALLYHRTYEQSEKTGPKWMRRSIELVQDYFDTQNENVILKYSENNPDWVIVNRILSNPEPLVTIIIPTHNRPDLLGVCLDGILNKTNYSRFEVIIIDHENSHPGAIKLFREYGEDKRVIIMPYHGVFDHSHMNNKAAEIALGEILLFLNDDIEIIEPNWLKVMISYFSRADCGVVGARLIYPNNKIQHAGVILGYGGVAGHAHVGLHMNEPGYFGRLVVASEISALTGACMAIRRDLFEAVAGFSAYDLKRTFNDVDLCLKAQRQGKKNIFTPLATLIHHESATDGGDIKLKNYDRLQGEVTYMFNTWGLMRDDPYYNVNLSLEGASFNLAFPPRRVEPWEEVRI